jgi:transketolase
MIILAPADEFECAAMIRWATAHQGPVYLRLAREAGPAVFDPDYRFELGRTWRLREGRDLLMISTGTQTARCLEAAERLAAQGLAAGVLHLPGLKPVNIDEIIAACEPAPIVFTVEEHSVLAGLGGLVSEVLAEHLPRRVIRIGIEDTWGESAPNEYLLDRFGLSAARVSARISGHLKHANI